MAHSEYNSLDFLGYRKHRAFVYPDMNSIKNFLATHGLVP